jgi:DNA replication licensing factor MCM3
MAADAGAIDAHKRTFREFLESDDQEGRYIDKLRDCINDQKFRLVVNVNDLRNFDRELAAK